MAAPDPHTELQHLRLQLQALLDAAQENERKLDRFDEVERRLIGAVSMSELMERLLVGSREAFQLDAVELWLLDPDSELRRTLAGDATARPRWLDGYGALASLYGASRSTLLLEPRHPLLARAFSSPGMRSGALLPLIREGVLIGSLHLGSRDAQRYQAGDGTKFLDRLGCVCAISIESTLNRERLRIAGMTDGLTGVHNRRYFDHRSQIEFSQAVRHRYPLAVLFLDLDHFKSINDGHGHQAGDEVLRQVGRLILQSLRGGDLAARYGGEEFVLLLPRTHEAGALEVAERIRQAVADRGFDLPSGRLRATLSVGLAVLEGGDLTGLLARADAAVYEAKRLGRNRTVVAQAGPPPHPAHSPKGPP